MFGGLCCTIPICFLKPGSGMYSVPGRTLYGGTKPKISVGSFLKTEKSNATPQKHYAARSTSNKCCIIKENPGTLVHAIRQSSLCAHGVLAPHFALTFTSLCRMSLASGALYCREPEPRWSDYQPRVKIRYRCMYL